MTYTERAFNVTDEDEIKRIREYIAALKAELARVRSLDPVEANWDYIGAVQRKIDALLNYPRNVRPPADTAELARLEAELNTLMEEEQQILNTPPIDNAALAANRAAQAAVEAEINAILAAPPTQGLTEGQKDELTRLYDERADAIQRYRVAREPKRGGLMRTDAQAWEDITGDVVWAQTAFTQAARTGPGSFTITLRGSHPFRAGEEIRLDIDDLRTFGGWVTSVERGYFFADSTSPKTVLHGTDYNILFDRLALRNYPWEYSASLARSRMMMGTYRNWPDFLQGTLDSDMIDVVFGEYLLPDLPMGFDYESGVVPITTPAPVSTWAMPEAGSTVRRFMQSISMITSGVWFIDPYMVLRYTDRTIPTGPIMPDESPIAITDGLGGISSQNMVITTDISPMKNDVFVWGTLAETISGEIMLQRDVGDVTFWERYWINLINLNQLALNRVLAIPLSKRTAKQKKAITTYRNRIAAYNVKLQDVRARSWDPTSGLPRPANAIVNSVDTWGRWQTGEFRSDIHDQDWLQMRAHAILNRYDEPLITAKATIWDPGFQAGHVVPVKSSVHGVDTTLVIRQLDISFSIPKEPHDGKFYALPRFDLQLGLEPEAPWNIYDFLPFPDGGAAGLGGDTTGG